MSRRCAPHKRWLVLRGVCRAWRRDSRRREAYLAGEGRPKNAQPQLSRAAGAAMRNFSGKLAPGSCLRFIGSLLL